MKKLTPKQEKFANLYVELGNASEAYRQSHDTDSVAKETVWVLASRLLNNVNVRIRVIELQNELGEKFKIKQGYIVNKLLDVINSAEETFELAKLENADKDETKRFFRMMNQTKNNDILSALNQLAKMLGLNEPEKVKQEIKIEIVEKKRDEL